MNIRSAKNFLRFFGYVRPYWHFLALGIVGGIFKFTLPLLIPQTTRYLIDNVFSSTEISSEQKINQLCLVIGSMIVLFIFFYAPWAFVRHYFTDKAGHRAVFALRCDLYYHILRLSASFFNRKRSGEIISRLISDVALAQNLVGTALTNTMMDGVAVIFVVIFLLRIDIPTTLVAFLIFPIYAYFFKKFGSDIRNATKDIQDEMAEMAGNVSETISANTVVKAFCGEPIETKKFHSQSEKLFFNSMKRIVAQSLNQTVTGTLTNLAPILVVFFAGFRAIEGMMSVGDLVAAIMYLGHLYLPIQRLSELNVILANGLAALDRIFEIMDEKPEIVDKPDAIEISRIYGKVEFDHVFFSYELNRPVLKNISFCVQPGQKIALVGHSGSGKTTIVSLILRFYDVNSGQVRIDDIDIKKIKISCLRKHIGVVLQEPILFSGTILENILYGNPTATFEQVRQAAHAANAIEFIENLPNGFDTEVGERGVLLSGGQKQRITIARAFLKNPSILILDEATSALDSKSEQLIQESIKELIKNRTVFIIAHRLSTLADADQILVLQKGQIVERGTHSELMKSNGLYAELYRKQQKHSSDNFAVYCSGGH